MVYCLADGFFRRPYSEVEDLREVPTIPVQPISYEDAAYFMSQLTEYNVPPEWEGDLNITYNILQTSTNTKYVSRVLPHHCKNKWVIEIS